MLVLTLAVTVGLAGGYLAGGRLRNMESLELRLPWLVLVAIAVQFAIFSPLGGIVGHHAVVVAHLASYGLLLAFAAANLRHVGIAVASVGIALNTLVIAVNGGYMPASAWAVQTAGLARDASVHNNSALADTGTRLLALGDVLAVPASVPLVANVFSVGDLLIAAGAATLLIMTMRPPLRSEVAG